MSSTQGDAQIAASLDQVSKAGLGSAAKGLGVALQNMLTVSNSRVPHEEGDLERDGAVVVDEDALVGAVTYGNNPKTAAYAERQHEDLAMKHDPGRTAKFLEQAQAQTREQNLAILANYIKEGMGT